MATTTEPTTKLDEIRAILWDEELDDWRELQSCADAIQDICLILDRPEPAPEPATPEPAEPDDPPPWAAFRLELLHSTDYKTAGTLLAPMVGFTLRLTSRGQLARDVSLIDHSHVRKHVGGITVRAVDHIGVLYGPREWIAYDDILVIGVY